VSWTSGGDVELWMGSWGMMFGYVGYAMEDSEG